MAQAIKKLTIFSAENPDKWVALRQIQISDTFEGIDDNGSVNPIAFKHLAVDLEPFVKHIRFTITDL